MHTPTARYSLHPSDGRYYIYDDYRRMLVGDNNVATVYSEHDAKTEIGDLNREWIAAESIQRVRIDRNGDRWYEWAQDDQWYTGPVDEAQRSRDADLRNIPITGHVLCLSGSDLEKHYGPTHLEGQNESPELARLGRERQRALKDAQEWTRLLREAVARESAAGRAEEDIAQQAGVTRMTVRSWLGKR